MTEFLIQRGHTELAFISGLDSHTASSQREAGFWAAIDAHGLNRKNMVRIGGDFSMQSGFRAIETLAKTNNNVTGVFAANDEMAIGTIIGALRDGKKVPEDMSVVGFDDSAFARAMWPPITSLAQPVEDMAKLSAQKLIDWIMSKQREQNHYELATEIRGRDSCP